MAKKSAKTIDLLPGSTIIEVVAFAPGKKPLKKEMTIDDANKLPRLKGWKYHRFQLGYSQFLNIVTK